MKLFAPEGNESAGGAGAVATPPAGSDAGGEGDFDFRSAAAKVFGAPPPVDRPTTTEKPTKSVPPNSTTKKPGDKPVDKAKPQEATKPETKPDTKVEEPPKRTSLFQKDPPPAAQKTDTPSTDDLDALDANIPQNDWKAAHSVRDQLKQQLRAERQKREEYEKTVTEFRKAGTDPAEVARLKEEYKAISDRLAILDFQSHPDFKRQFVEPKQKIIAGVSAILKENGIEDVNVNALSALPRSDFAKAIAALDGRLNSYDAEEVRANMRELQKLNQAERETVAKHGEVSQALRQQGEQKMRQAFEEVQKAESVDAWAKPFDLSADAPEERKNYWRQFNEAIPTVRKTAEKYAFGLADEHTAASVATKAANFDFFRQYAFPEMIRDHEEKLETIKQLTAKLEELNAHRPKTTGDGNVPAGSDQEEEFDVAKAAQKVFGRR